MPAMPYQRDHQGPPGSRRALLRQLCHNDPRRDQEQDCGASPPDAKQAEAGHQQVERDDADPGGKAPHGAFAHSSTPS
jgi:hypothetical protein